LILPLGAAGRTSVEYQRTFLALCFNVAGSRTSGKNKLPLYTSVHGVGGWLK
jgi:hypothetical protein